MVRFAFALGIAGVACGGNATETDGTSPSRPQPRPAEVDAGATEPGPLGEAGARSNSNVGGASGETGEPVDGADAGMGGRGEGGASAGSFAGTSGIGGSSGLANGAQGGATTSAGGVGPSSGGTNSGGTSTAGATGTGGTSAGGSGVPPDDELCEWGSYDTNPDDDELTCLEWSTCEPGTYIEEHGGFFQDKLCLPCPPGTIGTEPDAVYCDIGNKCALGEQVDVAATTTSDPVCSLADDFTPVAGLAGPLVSTGEALRLVVKPVAYATNRDSFLESYSFDGTRLDNWLVPEGETIRDMLQVGADTFVCGIRGDGLEFFLKNVALDGTVLWEQSVDDVGGYVSLMGMTSYEGTLQVTLTSYMDGGIGTQLDRYVFDLEGNPLSNSRLAGQTNAMGNGANVVAGGTNGHVFIGATTSILIFDGAGTLVAEPALGSYYWLQQLAADATGGVLALAADSSLTRQFLYQVAEDGDLLFGKEVSTADTYTLDAFTVTPNGIIAVGNSNDGPVLVSTDLNGEVLSVDVLEDRDPATFAGVIATDDGTVFVAGNTYDSASNEIAFVARWPD